MRQKVTRQDAINGILQRVEDWDIETLIDHAQHSMRKFLDRMTDNDLAREYGLMTEGDEMDKLIDLVGEDNLTDCEEL